jgi:hypothetical protein
MGKTWVRLMELYGTAWRCSAIVPEMKDLIKDAKAKLQKCMDTGRTKAGTVNKMRGQPGKSRRGA